MSNTAVKPGLTEPDYLHSVENGWKNTQEAYSIRATKNLADITQSNTVDNYQSAATALVKNGTYRGTVRQEANYLNWSNEAVKISSKIKAMHLRDLNISVQNLTVNTESEFNVSLNDRTRTFHTSGKRKVYGVEDPILQGIDTREIESCSFNRLAERVYTGSDANGTARGKTALEDISPQNEDEKILLTSDVEKYNEGDVRDLAGYVSIAAPSDPSSYNDVYTVGIPDIPDFDSEERAIIHQGLWKSNFFRTRDNECYLPASHEKTPSIADRIENKTRGSASQGVFTVISTGGSSESEIGYERADKSGLNLRQINGVSTGEGETWSNFRMSRGLAEELGLSSLM